MKMLGYVVFAIMVLAASIFVLRPDSKKRDSTDTRKTTVQGLDAEESSPSDLTPSGTESPGTVLMDKGPSLPAPGDKHYESTRTQAKPAPALTHDPTAEPIDFPVIPPNQGKDLLQAPEAGFGLGEAPDFPPLPTMEDDESIPFGELQMEGFGGNSFGWDDSDDGGFVFEHQPNRKP